MKKTSLKYILLIISASLFLKNTIAQAPPDPGSDPLKPDSTKEIIALQNEEPFHLNVYSNFLSERKIPFNLNKKSDNFFFGKKEEDNILTSLK